MASGDLCTGLTGGGAALDGLTSVSSGDIAITIDANDDVFYIHEATSGSVVTENSPQLINADDASGYWTMKRAYPGAPKGALWGFEPSPNTSNPTYQLDLSAGGCKDYGNSIYMETSSALTLDISTTGANGLSTDVSRGTAVTIHVHIMFDPTTATVACIGSSSVSSPVMPGNYGGADDDMFRHVYSFKLNTTGSGEIEDFIYMGSGNFRVTRYKTSKLDVDTATHGTTETTRTLFVPTGIRVLAYGNIYESQINSSLVFPADASEGDPAADASPLSSNSGKWEEMTDTSGQIKTDSSGASYALRLTTSGYKMSI